MAKDWKEKLQSFGIKALWWILFAIIILVLFFLMGPFIRSVMELFK